MNYETFKETILQLIREEFEEGVQVSLHEIPKNNGVIRDGLTILQPGQHISPTIYLEPYFEKFQDNTSLALLTAEIISEYNQGRGLDLNADFFTDFEQAAPRICYKVISRSKNETLLENLPHLEILDLAVVFYYKVEDEIAEGATILIHEKHRISWGILLTELYHLAKSNTVRCLKPVFQTIQQLICETAAERMPEIEEEQNPAEMYVLTNSEKYLGAVCFLYPGVLKEIASSLQSDFYILPSSIHESIIMPGSGRYSAEQLKTLVMEMNEQYIEKEEFLSDNIYFYNQQEETLTIA